MRLVEMLASTCGHANGSSVNASASSSTGSIITSLGAEAGKENHAGRGLAIRTANPASSLRLRSLRALPVRMYFWQASPSMTIGPALPHRSPHIARPCSTVAEGSRVMGERAMATPPTTPRERAGVRCRWSTWRAESEGGGGRERQTELCPSPA